MKSIIIAIDGYSSTGKSTLAKQLATYYNFLYVDSGAMYRAVSLFAMRNNFINQTYFDKAALIKSLDKIKLHFQWNEFTKLSEMYLNDENVESEIRTLAVSNQVSKIAALSEVRAMLVEQQQMMGKQENLIMDGRDIGTVVFPNADLKLFMSSSPKIRAQRRFEELVQKDNKITYEQVFQNISNRDYIDTNREDSPLKMAEDAIKIDNSELTLESQFEMVKEIISKKLHIKKTF